MSAPLLFGWESIDEIRKAFIEDYAGRVNETDAANFADDMAGLLIANLDSWFYEESAHFLFVREGQLYEVSASHCSCNDFEGQWSPDKVEWEQLAMRPKEWFAYDSPEVQAAADALVAANLTGRRGGRS